ncbi:MAG: lytic transglycosylase domain-containing protein [Fimbriimonadia bacterium]
MRGTIAALLLGLGVAALGDGLSDYLALRAKFGVKAPCAPHLVGTQPHGSVLEVSGRIQGTSKSGDSEMCILAAEEQALIVRGSPLPEWFGRGQVGVRLLIRVDAEGRLGMPNLHLIAAIGEGEIAAHEEKQRRAEEARRARAAASAAKSPVAAPAPKEDLPKTLLASLEQVLPGYKAYVKSVNGKLTDWEAEQIARSMLVFSAKHGVDPRLVTAVVVCESGFRPAATSAKGAAGLGQLMPSTARGMGVQNAYDTNENLEATVRLLRGHMLKYKPADKEYVDMKTLATALAAYNAGSGAVRKHGGIPPYAETRGYVTKVLSLYRRLCGE